MYVHEWLICMVTVGNCAIHGSYGWRPFCTGIDGECCFILFSGNLNPRIGAHEKLSSAWNRNMPKITGCWSVFFEALAGWWLVAEIRVPTSSLEGGSDVQCGPPATWEGPNIMGYSIPTIDWLLRQLSPSTTNCILRNSSLNVVINHENAACQPPRSPRKHPPTIHGL